MKIVSWNVNGYRSIYKKGFSDFVKNENPDILCIQETKAWPEQLVAEELAPLGYKSFFSKAQKKGYSGVATFINPKINILNHVDKIGIDKFDNEGRFAITKFPDFTLYNIYFPSGTTGDIRQNFKYDFLDNFLSHLQSLDDHEKKKIILCGDFNICHKEIDIHHPVQATKLELSGFLPDERAWMDKLCELGFVDAFRFKNGAIEKAYTWWTFRAGARAKNLGWRIDYFFVHNELANKTTNARILNDITGSDHVPVLIEIL
jgi:exodeoxyribonuclease-3